MGSSLYRIGAIDRYKIGRRELREFIGAMN